MEERSTEQSAIRVDIAAIFVSLKLSKSKWLVTSLSPGGGEKMLKHSVKGGDMPGLLSLFSSLVEKARIRSGRKYQIIAIQEAGLDGFWIHRALANKDFGPWMTSEP